MHKARAPTIKAQQGNEACFVITKGVLLLSQLSCVYQQVKACSTPEADLRRQSVKSGATC